MAIFDGSIRSEYTRKNYASHLARFIKFAKISSVETILNIPTEDIQHLVEDYLIEMRHETNPNSVPSMIQGVRHFCVMNRIRLDWDVIRKMFPSKKKPPSLRAYTNDEVRAALHGARSHRDKALIHFLTSTGARIGVFDHALEMRHLKSMPGSCTAVSLYADEIEEYWVFLTPQATQALWTYHGIRKRFGESFDARTPIFVSRGNSRQLGWSGARSAVYRTVSRSSIKRSKSGRRYDVQIDHGFRKRFNTVLKLDNTVNYNVVEKLMGHKNGLDGTYFTPTLEEMFSEFKKIINKLEV